MKNVKLTIQAVNEPSPRSCGSMGKVTLCEKDGLRFLVNEGACWHGAFRTRKEAEIFAAAPELLDALESALQLVEIARQYFPKSMRNSDKFNLENTCATIGTAIAKAVQS
jgi:hypothetical protein